MEVAGPYIMVVDDERSLCALLATMLSTQNVQVVSASTLKEAKEVISHNPPYLLFLDNSLPDGFGIDILPWIRSACPGLSIVMISGDPDDELKRRALDGGCKEFLEKPFSLTKVTELVNAVRSHH